MGNKYSFSEFIKTVYSLFVTKITMRQARLLRRPIYIRGKKSIVGANKITTGRFCRFDLIGTKPTLYIGDRCEMGDLTHIVAHNKVVIGNDVLIASKCFISDTDHGSYSGTNASDPTSPPNTRELISKTTTIGDRVWIGEGVSVLAGATIGEGCIIGAHSIVKGNMPPNTICVGMPARPVKKYCFESKQWVKYE